MKKNLLIEIGTEELPPKSLKQLTDAFAESIRKKLAAAQFIFSEIKSFATPRRLALFIQQLESQQPDRAIERRGPALSAAYDEHGKPTKALEGFARSCNTTIEKLEKLETPQGSWLICRYQEHGKTIHELLPTFVNDALDELPIPKPMRWDNGDIQFVRPIHWVVMLYGKEIIPGEILGIHSDRNTYGHRFHHPDKIKLSQADDYETLLKTKGKVIADFAERKKIIREQIETIAKQKKCQAIIPEELLDEVTSLVEWPVALLANFDKAFLNVPREALISAMQDHQRCFALEENKNTQPKLLPCFITISNIESKDPNEVIRGNERVMRARLSDAKFFYETDCKQKLESYLEKLKHVVFQAKLGSLYDKSLRVAALAKLIASTTNNDGNIAERAGLLCKTDLLTNMVGEFPELQGIMGYYYANHDGENSETALAIRDHYKPRFAGDTLPETLTGCAVALADRIDTLVGIFGINQMPTGDKDPFSLRRAALGIIRILIENEMDLDLGELLTTAQKNYSTTLTVDVCDSAGEFILARLPAWYSEQHIATNTVECILTSTKKHPIKNPHRYKIFNLHLQILALHAFTKLPEAHDLIEANKRSKNLLNKSNITLSNKVNPELFKSTEEKELYQAMNKIENEVNHNVTEKKYQEAFIKLASLHQPIARFFDAVLVMDENERLRNNRLALLAALCQLFLTVADISLLQL